MRILITNNALGGRAGTELYVRDVARRLQELGHEPVCFSLELGEVAAELRAAGIAVTDDLTAVAEPEVIHGHHAVETTLAGMRFPRAPILSFCHGAKVWQEAPCRLPSVVAHVAVSEACRQRLVEEENIPPEQVRLLLNFVDTRRFQVRAALPDAPRRALIFCNEVTEGPSLDIVRRVCENAGISLDAVGRGMGNVSAVPERLLGEYDLVFAKGRAALESMAVGCAVIQLDNCRAGHLVTSERFEGLRRHNFAHGSMTHAISAEHVKSQIEQYDAADAARVCLRVRTEASLDSFMPRLVEVYQQATATSVPEFDPVSSAGDFLRLNLILAKQVAERWSRSGEAPLSMLRRKLDLGQARERLEAEVCQQDGFIARTVEERRQMRQRWIEVREELRLAKERIRRLKQERTLHDPWWRTLLRRAPRHS